MGLSNLYGTANDDESIKLLEEAAKLGCVFWDTVSVSRIVPKPCS